MFLIHFYFTTFFFLFPHSTVENWKNKKQTRLPGLLLTLLYNKWLLSYHTLPIFVYLYWLLIQFHSLPKIERNPSWSVVRTWPQKSSCQKAGPLSRLDHSSSKECCRAFPSISYSRDNQQDSRSERVCLG